MRHAQLSVSGARRHHYQVRSRPWARRLQAVDRAAAQPKVRAASGA
jgi:hypothetical protein